MRGESKESNNEDEDDEDDQDDTTRRFFVQKSHVWGYGDDYGSSEDEESDPLLLHVSRSRRDRENDFDDVNEYDGHESYADERETK